MQRPSPDGSWKRIAPDDYEQNLSFLLAVFPLSGASPTIKVQLRTERGAKIVELPLERYVAAALAGESSVFQSQRGAEGDGRSGAHLRRAHARTACC